MEIKQWNKEHSDFLIENHGSKSFKELSESLGRSIESIRSKLKRLGFSKERKKGVVNNIVIVKSPIGKAASPEVIVAKKRKPKGYQPIAQDLNKLIPVQVDDKTVIYVKYGKNPIEARKKYMQKILEKIEQ